MWRPVNARTVAAALALALALAGPVRAGFPSDDFTSEWLVLPAQPTTRDLVKVRNIVNACNPARGTDNIATDLATGTIDLFFELGSDA